jgi:site-specific recombinase XerD
MNLPQALSRLEAAELRAGHLPNTRKTYRRIVEDYAAQLTAGTATDFQTYLDFLAADRRVSPKTVKQALNGLVFFFRHVLDRDPGRLRIPHIGKSRRMPVFLTHGECLALLSHMDRGPRLQAALLYGCGLRVTELLQLRLKDLDLAGGMLTVRSGKGDKDRTVRLPASLIPEIGEQIRRCRRQWERDHAAGLSCPTPSPSLARKLGPAVFARVAWYWFFPSRVVRGTERWHGTAQGISKSLQLAASAAGILKRVSPHVLRHSYATNLIRNGVDIRTLQDQLGHANVATTEIYCHAVGARGVPSPLDAAPDPVIVPFVARHQRSA